MSAVAVVTGVLVIHEVSGLATGAVGMVAPEAEHWVPTTDLVI